MSRNSTVDKMVAYMNEKYDDHFEYSAPFGGSPGAAARQIIVTSEKFPEARVWVQYEEKDGSEVWADNYVAIKYEEQTRAALEQMLEDAFHGETAVSYSVGMKGTANRFTESTTFEEFRADTRIGFQAIVLLSAGWDGTELEYNLKGAAERAELTAFGSIYFTDSRAVLDGGFAQSQKDLDLLDQLQFSMSGPNSFTRLEWRPGNDG